MKLFSTFIIALLLASLSYSQSITEIIFPQYVQGSGTGVASADRKVPYVCRLQINGLPPNTTYRYWNRFVLPSGSGGTLGNYILVKNTGDFARVTLASLSVDGRYGQFTTDAAGSYTGWFSCEVTSNSTFFVPGNELQMIITLNNGDGGSTVGPQIKTTNTIKVINFDNTSTGGSSIRSTPVTGTTAKNFVFLWDNPDGAGRPVSGSYVESEGIDNTTALGYAPFYATEVSGKDKTWGNIIPNNLTNGIQRIGQYSLIDGSEVGYKIADDGYWPTSTGARVSTANTTNGLTSTIVLDGAVARLDGANVKSDQAIAFNALPVKTYGDADFAAGATAGAQTPVGYTSNNTNVVSLVNGQLHIAGAGTADITATHPGDDFYKPATAVVQTITVNKAPLTIKADDQAKVQGDPNPPFTLTYTGFVNGENASSLSPQPVVSTTATTSSPADTYPITVDGAGSLNYEITYIPGELKVTSVAQPQTITFPAFTTKTYGDSIFDPGATTTSDLTISYTSDNPAVATVVNGLLQITGTGTAVITASQGGTTAYEPAPDVVQTLVVNPAALTIKADDKDRLYGHDNPVLTISYTGFVNNETPAVLSIPVTISTMAVASSPAGDYPITVEDAVAANYVIRFINGTLKINPLPAQVITFKALPVKTYGSAPFAAGASSSSGLTVEYTSSDPAIATVANGLITIRAAGSVTITASQPGNGSFMPADPVAQTLTVKKANLSVFAQNLTKKEGENNPLLVIQYSGFANGDDAGDLTEAPVVSTLATTAAVAGVYPITISGISSAPNYNIGYFNGKLTILPSGSDSTGYNLYISTPGRLRVNYYADTAAPITIQLFDSQGGRVLESRQPAVRGMNTWYLEVAHLSTGIYPVRISGEGRIVKTKVFIR